MVPMTHASVCLSAYNAGAALALGPRDRLLNVLPLFHAHGLISGVDRRVGGWVERSLRARLRCRLLLRLAERVPTHVVYGGPDNPSGGVFHGGSLTSAASSACSLRLIRSASASLPPDVLDGLEALFGVPVIETYGMTEAASQIAANPWDDASRVRSASPPGPRLRSWTMRADGYRPANVERSRCEARPSRGGTTMIPPLPSPRFGTAGSEPETSDTWTGDGYLFIVGRIKDIINRGGQKVAPTEVEEALLGHPDVLEAAVFSIPHRRLGEDVAAAVVLRPDAKVGAHEAPKLRPKRLARFKVPSSDPDRAGNPERPKRKDQASRTRRRAFNRTAKGASGARRQVWLHPARNWSGNWPTPGRSSWSSIRSALTKMCSRSARIPLR